MLAFFVYFCFAHAIITVKEKVMEKNKVIPAAYAAYKELERFLKNEQVAPGEYDLGGVQVEVTIPDGTSLSKAEGYVEKVAAQNLYGYAVLFAVMEESYRVLRKFRQEQKAKKMIERMIKRIVKKAATNGVSSEQAFLQACPHLKDTLERTKEEIRELLPKRKEETPRVIKRPKEAPVVVRISQKEEANVCC